MLRILVFVLCCCGIANALSLQEAIMLTLQNNQSIKEQEFLLQESKASYKTYQSPFYPSFNLNYGALKSNRIQRVDKKTSGNFGGNLQYNLFNGFSDIYALKSAKALMESQNYQLEATREDVILLVKSAYIDVLRQEQNVRIAEQSKTLLEEQRRQNADFYRVGLIQKNDLLKIEVELNNTLQNLLTYKSALNYALRNLERYIKMQITKESLEALNIKDMDLEFNALKVDMLQNRSELLFIDKIIESKRYLTQSAKGNFLPEVEVIGAYTRFGDDYKLRGREGVYNDETNEHVDNVACFLKPGVIALASCHDKDDVQHQLYLQDLEYLKKQKDAKGRKLEIIEIETPSDLRMTKKEADGLVLTDAIKRPEGNRLAGSYINFYQSDKFVIVPKFNHPLDDNAYRILKDFYQDKDVIQLESREILLGGGNIHCVTNQIPKEK